MDWRKLLIEHSKEAATVTQTSNAGGLNTGGAKGKVDGAEKILVVDWYPAWV